MKTIIAVALLALAGLAAPSLAADNAGLIGNFVVTASETEASPMTAMARLR